MNCPVCHKHRDYKLCKVCNLCTNCCYCKESLTKPLEFLSIAEIKTIHTVFHIKFKLDASVLLLRDAQCQLNNYYRLLSEQIQEGDSMVTIEDLRVLDSKIDSFIGDRQDDTA